MAGDNTEVEDLKVRVTELESELTATKQALEKSQDEVVQGAKALGKTQRQLEKANLYNNDLRKQMEKLSKEIQEFRDRKRAMKHVEVQAIAEEILTEQGEKPLPQWENGAASVSTVQEGGDKSSSIAESLKQTAEAALAQSGFVFDENTGLYYDYNSGYYYNHEHGLYYDPGSGSYFYYDEASGEYTFHSQVAPQQYTCTTSQTSQQKKHNDRKMKNKEKRKKEKESEVTNSTSDVDEVTSALHKLEIEHRRQHALDVSSNWPPCIRMMVTESDCLAEGTLFIITCDGATIGREKDMNHLVRIPDINVSKLHAEIQFDYDLNNYVVIDCESQNGTFLNNKYITQVKNERSVRALSHGDTLQIGKTTLLVHIHPGTETCDDCEPGQVLSRIQAMEKANREVTLVSKSDRQKQQKQQLKQIKKKYGLENAAYVDNMAAVNNPAYQDKAATRRKNVGSDNPHVPDEAPASVMRPISTENKGHKLLAKMGWKEGQGLGRDNAGIAEPINVMLRTNQSAGLGSSTAVEKTLDDVHSAKKSQRWLQAQQRYNQLEKKPVDLSKPTNLSFSFKKGPTVNLEPKVDLGAGESDEEDGEQIG